MRIYEALKRLGVVKEGWPLTDTENYFKAVELGIEALRRIQRQRKDLMPSEIRLLLGETKD